MTNRPVYRLTPDAETDLIDIRLYTLKQWGSNQSLKYLSKLREALILLVENPAIGKLHLDIGENSFSFPYVSHVIYYTLDNQQLVVFAVLHKNMVPYRHLEERNTN